MPEGLIVIAADSLQNWPQVDQYFSPQAVPMMKKAGFIQAANIGPEWQRVNSTSCLPTAGPWAGGCGGRGLAALVLLG